MRSVADQLRAEERRALAALAPGERVRLALDLGARDLESFRLNQSPPLDPAEADRVLRRRRQLGRRPSRCALELIGGIFSRAWRPCCVSTVSPTQ